jgi:hypothetical protein
MSPFHTKPPRYQSYMLRLWEVRSQRPGQPSTWHFSLEDPQTGQRHVFPDLEALVAFLQAELEGSGDEPAQSY